MPGNHNPRRCTRDSWWQPWERGRARWTRKEKEIEKWEYFYISIWVLIVCGRVYICIWKNNLMWHIFFSKKEKFWINSFFVLSWYTMSSFTIILIKPLVTSTFFIHHLTAMTKMTQWWKVEDQFDIYEMLMAILTQKP